MAKDLIIIGAGGAGCEALWVSRRMGVAGQSTVFRVLGFADDNLAVQGHTIDGCPVLGSTAEVLAAHAGKGIHFHCAIGHNRVRQKLAAEFEAVGFVAATLIDPSTIVAETAVVGDGSYLGPQSNVSPFARVGRHVLINTQVSVGHHAEIMDFSQLCPGSRLSGHSRIGVGAFVASNAVVAPGGRIGEWATLGASSFAMKEVPDGVTAVGNPARVVLR